MTIQYASLEDAWGGASSTPQYPVDDSFAVAKNDGVKKHTSYPGSIHDDVTMALESAYPAHAEAQRLPRSAAATPPFHVPNDMPCDAAQAEYAPQYDAPEDVYATAGESVGTPHQRRRPSGSHAPSFHMSAADQRETVRRVSGNGSVSQAQMERAAMYDILLFVLFGLLMVLTLHEAATLGELIGRRSR